MNNLQRQRAIERTTELWAIRGRRELKPTELREFRKLEQQLFEAYAHEARAEARRRRGLSSGAVIETGGVQ